MGHSQGQPGLQEGGVPCSCWSARSPTPEADFTGTDSWRDLPRKSPHGGREQGGPWGQTPSPAARWTLTKAGHGECTGSGGRGDAVGEHGLQHVVGEGHGDDGQAGGVHDEDGTPEQQEAGRSEGPSGWGLPAPSQPRGPRYVEWGCTLGPGTRSCCAGQIPALVQGGRANLVEVSALFMNCFNRESVQRK